MAKFTGRIFSDVELSPDLLSGLDQLANKSVHRRETAQTKEFYGDRYVLPDGAIFTVVLGEHTQYAVYEPRPPSRPRERPEPEEPEQDEAPFGSIRAFINGAFRVYGHDLGVWHQGAYNTPYDSGPRVWKGPLVDDSPSDQLTFGALSTGCQYTFYTNGTSQTTRQHVGPNNNPDVTSEIFRNNALLVQVRSNRPCLGAAIAQDLNGDDYVVAMEIDSSNDVFVIAQALSDTMDAGSWIEIGTVPTAWDYTPDTDDEEPSVTTHRMPEPLWTFSPDGLTAVALREWHQSSDIHITQSFRVVRLDRVSLTPTANPLNPFTFSSAQVPLNTVNREFNERVITVSRPGSNYREEHVETSEDEDNVVIGVGFRPDGTEIQVVIRQLVETLQENNYEGPDEFPEAQLDHEYSHIRHDYTYELVVDGTVVYTSTGYRDVEDDGATRTTVDTGDRWTHFDSNQSGFQLQPIYVDASSEYVAILGHRKFPTFDEGTIWSIHKTEADDTFTNSQTISNDTTGSSSLTHIVLAFAKDDGVYTDNQIDRSWTHPLYPGVRNCSNVGSFSPDDDNSGYLAVIYHGKNVGRTTTGNLRGLFATGGSFSAATGLTGTTTTQCKPYREPR